MSTSDRQLDTAADLIFQSSSEKRNTDRDPHAVFSGASNDTASASDFASTLAAGIWFLVMLGVAFGSAIYCSQCLYGALIRINVTNLMTCI